MFVFDDFTLDAREYTLRRGERVLRLRPKSFETLLYLVEHRSELVRKDDLLDSLWAGVVVSEGALSHCIEEVRAALGDDPHHPRYIQTVPKIGYKFVAPVRHVTVDPASEPERGAPATVEEEVTTSVEVSVKEESVEADGTAGAKMKTEARVFGSRRRWSTVVATAAAVLVTLLAAAIMLPLMRKGAQPTPLASIAVLPFKNLNTVPEQEYLADGLTDALTAELARIGKLRVVSRTSAASSGTMNLTLPEIAKVLDVDGVVEGSVLRSDGRVLITAELIDARHDRHLWSESYDRDFKDVVQALLQVTKDIADEIRVSLTAQESSHLARALQPDPVAYEAYLKGRYFWNRRWEVGFRKALDCFEQAVNRDPGYAAAYAGIADCYNMLGNYDLIPPHDVYPRAKSAAVRALALDPSLADAHASLGFALMMFDWKWNEAESEFRTAIALNPNCVSAHHWYGLLLAMHGRFDAASEEMTKARSLDPLSLIVLTNSAWVRYFARDYDHAIRVLRDCLQMDPDFISAHIKLGWALEQAGRADSAVPEFQRALQLTGDSSVIRLMLAHTLALTGDRTRALAIITQMIPRSDTDYIPAFHIADAYAGLGVNERAMEWLQEALHERSGWLCWLKVDPKLDALRSDRRFRALLDSLAL